MPKWVWSSMNQYRMFLVQTSTPTPSMHQKFTKDGRCCMQTTNSQPEVLLNLKDNSISWNQLRRSWFTLIHHSPAINGMWARNLQPGSKCASIEIMLCSRDSNLHGAECRDLAMNPKHGGCYISNRCPCTPSICSDHHHCSKIPAIPTTSPSPLYNNPTTRSDWNGKFHILFRNILIVQLSHHDQSL